MLQTIHDKITGWVAGIVIFLIAVPFIFWGIDVGFGAVSYAARVDSKDLPFWRPSTKISLQEVSRQYQNQLNRLTQAYGGEVPEEQRTQLQERLLESYIRNELMNQRTNALGYRVSDADVLKAYEEIPEFQLDGKFSNDVATRVLQSQGISPAQFENDQRRELQVTQLQDGIAFSAFVTPQELERARALQDEQREVAWFVIPASRYAAQGAPDEAAISAYYEKNKADYVTPETLTLKYVELQVSDLLSQVTVTEAQLQEYYESVKDKFIEPEKRRGRHILLQVSSDKEDAAARKRAEEVLAKVNAGGDFAKLAQEYSQDAGSAAQGGDLGWAERSFFVGPFADALFAMKVGEVRGPVRSQFGYHIIRLDAIDAGRQRTFEDVRAELETDYRREQAETLFGERQEQMAATAFEKLDSLDAVAAELGLTQHEVTGFTRAEGGGPFGARPDVIQAAFSEDVLNGQNSQPIELEPGHAIVLRVDRRDEAKQKPLDQVRGEIVAAIEKQRGEELARKAGADAVEQLKSGTTTWEKAVSALKVEAQGPKWVGRADSTLPVELRNALFAAPKPTAEKAARHFQAVPLGTGDYAVMALSGARVEATAETPEQRQVRVRQATGRVATGEIVGYLTQIRERADVHKNPKTFE
jgi:peptidyl-prolyl cis-trans isomerase D